MQNNVNWGALHSGSGEGMNAEEQISESLSIKLISSAALFKINTFGTVVFLISAKMGCISLSKFQGALIA